MDGKRGQDRYSMIGSKETDVKGASSKDALFIIWSYWPNLRFSGIGIGICGDDPGTHKPDVDGTDD